MTVNFQGWQQIYKDNKKTGCSKLRNKSGVYCLAFNDSSFDDIIYIGMASTDLEDVITRHFQKGNNTSAKFDRTAGNFFLNVAFLPKRKAQDVERYLIGKLIPRDNKNLTQPTLFDKMTIFKRYTGIEDSLSDFQKKNYGFDLYGNKLDETEDAPF